MAAFVVAYALSPIDRIPDFIPVFGHRDGRLLVPVGLCVTARLIPTEAMEEGRGRATRLAQRPVSRTAAFVIVNNWSAAAIMAGWLVCGAPGVG